MKIKNVILILLVFVIMVFLGSNKVGANSEPFHNFTGMYVITTEVQKGEKVYVEFYGMEDITSVKAYLMGDGDYLTVDVIDFKTNKPYFIMPEIAKEGQTYEIILIEINCEHGKIQYSTSQGSDVATNCFGRKYITVSNTKTNLALTNLSLGSHYDTIKKGENERIWLDVEIKGTGTVDLVTMIVTNKEQKDIKTLLPLNNDAGLQYIDFSNIGTQGTLIDGDYYISDVFINPNMEDYIWYSSDSQATNALPLEYNVEFKIANNEEENVENITILKNIKLLENIGKQNGKVYVDLEVDNFELNQVMLSFNDAKNNNNFVVYLEDVKNNSPYFVVPFTTELGSYELNYVILKDLNGNEKHYRKGKTISTIEHFDFDSVITIEGNDLEDIDILNLDNDKITMEIIQQIYRLDSNITIGVDASNNPIINKSLFEAIRGQNKILIIKYNDVEWIFNGTDISESKSLDVSVQITNDINDINEKVNDGIRIEFAENGKLPGKCLIRIYNSEVLNKTLNQQKSNVYYYNEDNGLFNEIALNINITDDGYYEFYISHNSSYIMTKEKISEEYVTAVKEEINKSNASDSSQLNKIDIKYIYILIAAFILVVITLVIVIIRLARK